MFADVRIDDELAKTVVGDFVAIAALFVTLVIICVGFRIKKRIH